MLRIISGLAKGRHLKVPGGSEIRPTSDKVRESIFNIIGHDSIVDSTFLDLFSGSGAVGIEAISRGAKHVTFVDNNIRHIRTIKENIKICGFQQASEILSGNVITILNNFPARKKSFNIVFADPPYSYGKWDTLLSIIVNNVIILDYGFFIIEHSSKVSMPERLNNLENYGKYIYGDTTLTVYRKYGNNSDLSRDI